jgi:positive phototaxis protein PixI
MQSGFFLSSSALSLNQETTGREENTVQYLRFHLVPDTTAILPVNQITEVLTIAQQNIVPIPHMNNYVMGVYNWRGEILWMIDLGHLIGLTPWYEQQGSMANLTAIVLHEGKGKGRAKTAGTKTVGLVVKRVEDIEWLNPDFLESPPASAVTPELVPFLQGYWLKNDGTMLMSLGSYAILQSLSINN